MDIKKALKTIYEKEKGELVPIDGFESEKFYKFTVVTAKGRELIGNNAVYIVTKDGKICDWIVGGIVPEQYRNSELVREITNSEIKKIWREFA